MAHPRIVPLGVALAFAAAGGGGGAVADPALVATTPHRTPDEEKALFHLPPGFEAELVAAEPDIHKPMNIAFDDRGRLWVTDTVEYPFPAPPDRVPKDSVKILENFDERGRARKITTFADGLNIPIGVLPVRDGAIVHSIPNIYRLIDDDGDGRADRREVLFGAFGHDDTHGMTSAFTVGFDGWVYACHGYSNDTTLKASDGSSIHMKSGNTYRFRADGAHIEQFTWGQINPFGLCFDPLGNLYSADCHSKPVTMLLRGGYYTSWGVSQDGLGEAPQMCDHDHGSTAIAGVVYYAAEDFPPEYRDTVFIGNVVTNRINHDRLERHGSTLRAIQQPDFLVSDDPWFRPVAMQLGADGALYVADFYNRIIGHYEVPLTHPGRDRESGRLWRIVYRGPLGEAPSAPLGTDRGKSVGNSSPRAPRDDWRKASFEDLVGGLAHANLAVRMKAMHQLVERGKAAIPAVVPLMGASISPFQRAHALWVLERLGALDEPMLSSAARDPEPAVRVHAMRALAERTALSATARALAVAGLEDPDAFVQRAAADALGRHPGAENLAPLLALRRRVPPDDTHLLHTVRMALREQLRDAAAWAKLPLKDAPAADEDAIADIALGVPNPEAGSFLLKRMKSRSLEHGALTRGLRHAARYIPADEMDALASFVRGRFENDLDLQRELFKAVLEGAAQRGASPSPGLRAWGAFLADKLLALAEGDAGAWVVAPLPGKESSLNPWSIQKRPSADGDAASPFLSSLPMGEKLTGVVRSRPFAIPPRLKFFLAGHNGGPGSSGAVRNIVRLRAADTQDILAEAPPPRSDTAQPVEWDLAAHAGKQGILEAVDGRDGGGYAWLAFGRLDPPVVPFPAVGPGDLKQKLLAAMEMAATLRLAELEAPLKKLLASRSSDPDCRAGAIKALLAINCAAHAKTVGEILQDAGEAASLRVTAADQLGGVNRAEARDELARALPSAPQGVAKAIADALAHTPAGAEALIAAVASGKASARLLQRPGIQGCLTTAGVKPERLAELTRGLPAADKGVQDLIDRRRAWFASAKADAEKGAGVFEKNCAICHQIAGKGARVGPQLDGIGVRGAERLLEDVLDPNRNVDQAFRATLLTLTDGRIVTGVVIREEGETLIVADGQGKENRVAKGDIGERAVLPLSPMPSNFGEQIPEADLYDLLEYLLSRREGGAPR